MILLGRLIFFVTLCLKLIFLILLKSIQHKMPQHEAIIFSDMVLILCFSNDDELFGGSSNDEIAVKELFNSSKTMPFKSNPNILKRCPLSKNPSIEQIVPNRCQENAAFVSDNLGLCSFSATRYNITHVLLVTLVCKNKYRAPSRCIHDPTFRHSSLVSSSGVI